MEFKLILKFYLKLNFQRNISCKNQTDYKIQSTLIISNSKGLHETLRDIRTSTYKICGTEESLTEWIRN